MSDTAIATPKQKIIDKASKAVAGKQVCDPKSPCQPCQRADLQLLIVLPSVVPADHKTALGDAGYAWAPSFDPAFAGIKREATMPVARIMREGYVYLYYLHRKRWDVWQVMENGLTRKIMNQVDKKEYEKLQAGFVGVPAPKSCSRGSANVPAHLISVPGAKTTPKLWLAFSSQLWSGYVLQRFADNPEVDVPGADGKPVKMDLRATRGREISPQKVIADGISNWALPLNQPALEHAVADFVKSASEPFRRAFDITLTPFNEGRPGKADLFVEAVRKLEKASAPPSSPELYLNKSIILMLPDPLGVVEQHNNLRLVQQEAKRLWTIGANGVSQAPDPERVWKLRSSLHADMIEQWEAASDAKRITDQVNRDMHKNIRPMTEEQFLRDRANGKLPPGTEWQPVYFLDGGLKGKPTLDANKEPIAQTTASIYNPGTQTRLGRLILPPDMVEQQANKHGADKATGFRERLRGRLNYQAMLAFRAEFKIESEKWDKRIVQFDRDYLTWRDASIFRSFVLYDFNSKISLVKLDPALGSADQQAGDVIARVIALEKALGGGAISPESSAALAAQYRLKSDDSAKWITDSLYNPFSFEKEVWDDPGNRSEAAEGVAATKSLVGLGIDSFRRNKDRHRFESAARTLLETHAQLTHLVASALDAKTAKNLGLQTISQDQARRCIRFHIKIELLIEDLVVSSPAQLNAQKFVFNMKIPAGVALNEVHAAMHARLMPTEFAARADTTKKSRQYARKQFKTLRDTFTGSVHYPVLLDHAMIEKMQSEAVASGKRLVEVVPDGELGLSSGRVMLPEDVARRMIREQAVTARMKWRGEGLVLRSVVFVQLLAIYDTGTKIFTEQGVSQEDAVLSTISTVLGLLESHNLMKLHAFTLQANGMRTMSVNVATSMSHVRMRAGQFGAAASIIDATLAFVKAGQAKRAGDKATAKAFNMAGALYLGSAFLSVVGAFATYQSYVAQGIIVRALGVRGAVLMGGWATGVGIVLSLAAFGYMLYALHTAYQMTDIFLDRSYWGKGEHEKFGYNAYAEIARIGRNKAMKSDARGLALNTAVNDGMTAEIEAFLGLTIGLKITFEWHKNLLTNEIVAFKVEAVEWQPTQKMTLKMALFAGSGAPAVIVIDEKNLVLSEEKNDDGFLELEKNWVFKDGTHGRYTHARVTFDVIDDDSDLYVKDTWIAKRDA